MFLIHCGRRDGAVGGAVLASPGLRRDGCSVGRRRAGSLPRGTLVGKLSRFLTGSRCGSAGRVRKNKRP